MSKIPSDTETVKVMVRVRPMNSTEIAKGCKSVIRVDKATNQIEISKPETVGTMKNFSFDSVYDVDS